MNLKLRVSLSDESMRDVSIKVDTTTTVAELAHALVSHAPVVSGPGPIDAALTLKIENSTRSLDPKSLVQDSGLSSGMTVKLCLASDTTAPRAQGMIARATVRFSDGTNAVFDLDYGSTTVGRSVDCFIHLPDARVAREHARIIVAPESIELVDLGSASGTYISDTPVTRTVIHSGDVVRIGDAQIVVEMRQTLRTDFDGPVRDGAITFIRAPRFSPAFVTKTLAVPPVTTIGPTRSSNNRTTELASLAVSALVALVVVAVLEGVTAAAVLFFGIIAFGLVYLAKDKRRSSAIDPDAELFRHNLSDLRSEVAVLQAEEAAIRLLESPTSLDCLQAVVGRTDLLWSRKPGTTDFLKLRLGTGTQQSRIIIAGPTHVSPRRDLEKELEALIAEVQDINGVPVLCTLPIDGAAGISGNRQTALALTRGLILQAVALHSPAELKIIAFTSTDTCADWDWLKWLPHTEGHDSPLATYALSANSASAANLLSELENLLDMRSDPEQPTPLMPNFLLIVEDGAAADRGRLTYLAARGTPCGIHVIWIASDRTQLPAACVTYVEVSADKKLCTVTNLRLGIDAKVLEVEQLAGEAAELASMALAPVVDAAARSDEGANLPRTVSLLSLIGEDLAEQPEKILERWLENGTVHGSRQPSQRRLHSGSLRAAIGLSVEGVHTIDLRTDGPHALIGGTTGAGKSELLQTWILSLAAAHGPDRLTFLLVDYKGGSAFRECVNLPHTVGLVTDLSPHLVRRALTSLQAELRYREWFFSRHGAKDLRELERRGIQDTPPSLIIVIDEFAALISEVPEFMDGVVNVAQRGRSLGLHLILGTQRPAGIIKNNLRANTNLRIALRMADDEDSIDVLGSPLAATFDAGTPGRAVSRTGPRLLVPFQTAYSGGSLPSRPQSEVLIRDLALQGGEIWSTPDDAPLPDPDSASDMTRLVGSIRHASELAGILEPRRPWLPELRHTYSLTDLMPEGGASEIPFGMQDYPESQTQGPAVFRPDHDGNMLVVGTGGSGKSTILRSLAAAFAMTRPGGSCHVYGLDYSGGGLAPLKQLLNVGSIVSGADEERVTRLLTTLTTTIAERSQMFADANCSTITEYWQSVPSSFDTVPRVVLLLDGFSAFRQAHERTDRLPTLDMLTSAATDGRSVGVHVVITADRRSALPTQLQAAIPKRVILRLASPEEALAMGLRNAVPGDAPPGRGVVDSWDIQVAVLGGNASLLSEVANIEALSTAMAAANIRRPVAVGSLPSQVLLDDLPLLADGLPTIGVANDTLQPAGLGAEGTFLIAGPPGSGRTTALRTVARAMARCIPTASLLYFGGRRAELSSWTGWAVSGSVRDTDPHSSLEAIMEALSVGRSISKILVFESVLDIDGHLGQALERVARLCIAQDGLLVVDGDPGQLSSSLGLSGLAKADRAGIALSPDPSDGLVLFRKQFPRLDHQSMPTGRGFLVSQNRSRLVQMAL